MKFVHYAETLGDAKGNAYPAEWYAGTDVFFYLSLVAADKALAGLGQCRFILCIVAGFKLGRYLYLLGGCPQTQRLSRLARPDSKQTRKRP